ncbi:hypothetical protein ABZ671_00475 [Micromonospora sp. NPDC006766]|uniref:hypothetical protein n=1 Tax=Micromonospora sp. NPDC006766 TaxID=3154778 RepID=UPI0034099651
MTTDFRPGELVDVVIRAARVIEPRHTDDTALTLAYAEPQPGIFATLCIDHFDAKRVEITRVAPAEWPPQPGDLWRSAFGRLWFVYSYVNGEGRREQRFTPADDRAYGGNPCTPEALLSQEGPLTLVHREHRDDADGADL